MWRCGEAADGGVFGGVQRAAVDVVEERWSWLTLIGGTCWPADRLPAAGLLAPMDSIGDGVRTAGPRASSIPCSSSCSTSTTDDLQPICSSGADG